MTVSFLIIEAENSVREALEAAIAADFGTSAQLTTTVDPAVVKNLELSTFNFVIIDAHVEGIDAIETVRGWRNNRYLLTMIIGTSKRNGQDSVLFLEAGCDDFLTKPYDPKEMMARVRAMLRRMWK